MARAAPWTFILACLIPGLALADQANPLRKAQEDLLASMDDLKAAIAHKLEVENHSCSQGVRNSCQDALLSTAALGIVNAEIALKKLGMTVKSDEINELIDDAADQLDSTQSALDEIQEELDE